MTESLRLTEREDASTVSCLRLNTHTGRLLATDTFLSNIETVTGSRLRPRPTSQPQKRDAQTHG